MRIDNPAHLHAEFRARIGAVVNALHVAGIPLAIYETVRTPWRQAALYARGRSAPGRIVTRARAWESLHQYGLAADLVFRGDDGRWTWVEPKPGAWDTFHRVARAEGLEPLSFEKPHVQLPWAPGRIRLGDFPDAGGVEWSRWLSEQIGLWGSGPRVIEGIEHPGAPDDAELDARPALDDVT